MTVAGQVALLTGASGLLGTWLRRTAPPGWTVVPVLHRTRPAGLRGVDADLRDAAAVERAMAEVAPDLVLHAAYAQDERSIVDATANVADAARRGGTSLLQVSTDAVFCGDGRPRAETDAPDPVHDYGRWKADAERLALASGEAACVVRLPLVVSVGPDDPVVARLRRDGEEGATSTWFSDEVRQPAAASDLAAAIWSIAALPAAERSGAWHLPGPERLSRFAIARRLAATLGLDERAVRGEPTPAGAMRPRDLHLEDGRARTMIGWDPSPILTSP